MFFFKSLALQGFIQNSNVKKATLFLHLFSPLSQSFYSVVNETNYWEPTSYFQWGMREGGKEEGRERVCACVCVRIWECLKIALVIDKGRNKEALSQTSNLLPNLHFSSLTHIS